MQSSNNTSSLLNHAVKIRAKNVELREQIAQLQTDTQSIEKDVSILTRTYDSLVEQCQTLREKQTDDQNNVLLEEYEREFQSYIRDIENYIMNKQWSLPPSIEKTSIPSPKPSTINEIPLPTTLNDDLNQQLASVENWLMESAVTDTMKSTPLLAENARTEDATDDLYKDLIFPTFAEQIPTPSNEISFDENHHQEEFGKTISSDNSKQQQQARLDKNQRRFVLMRQLAEKSNKTVTKKLL